MVDIDPAANDAAFEQMLALSGAGVTMWREGKALTRSVRREAAPTACFGARADRTYLIAGGYGGVGLELGLWLVRCGGKNLALIGRNPDGSAAQAAVARLRAEGARVLAVAADIGDEAQTTAALARIRREMPPLAGVIHAAGVYADRLLKNHDAESFAQALHPKVRGAWNLHTLTVGDALDFFILCSSAASMLGAAGLANYSAANAYLDGLAHFRAARGLPALSVNWGPWLGTGMADAVGERRTAQWLAHGITPIRPEEALTALESLLASGAVQAGVFHLAESKAAADAGMRPMLREMPASARRRAMVSLVRDTVAEKLGYQPASALPLREGFFRIGMDSLVALEVVKALRASTGCDLQQTALFAHSDVEALSDYLLGEMFAAAEPSAEEGMPADFERELEGLEALLAATA
jgi:NAD(P)-dependent dehydrogenase (short-subunit alcohol dehydrogenase family)/acyl carrier protein